MKRSSAGSPSLNVSDYSKTVLGCLAGIASVVLLWCIGMADMELLVSAPPEDLFSGDFQTYYQSVKREYSRQQTKSAKQYKKLSWSNELLRGAWDTTNSQVNIVECNNLSKNDVSFRFNVLNANGGLLTGTTVKAKGLGSIHIPISEKNAGGSYVVKSAKQQNSSPLIHCYTVVYLENLNGEASEVEHAYPIPALETINGISAGSVGSAVLASTSSFEGSVLTIFNLGTSLGSFTIELYNGSTKVKSIAVNKLKAGARKDVRIKNFNGIFRIIPINETPYSAYLRHSKKLDKKRFRYITVVQAKQAARSLAATPVTTAGPATDWAELVNPSSSTVSADLMVYGPTGQSLHSEEVSVEPYSRRSIKVSEYLSSVATGYFTVEAGGDGLIAQSVHYGYSDSESNILWAYYSQADEASESTIVGLPYNTYLGTKHRLKSIYRVSQGKLQFKTPKKITTVTSFPGLVESALNRLVGSNSIGVIIANSDVTPEFELVRTFPGGTKQNFSEVLKIPIASIPAADIPGISPLSLAQKTITITAPLGGTYNAGSKVDILWSSEAVDKVGLIYTRIGYGNVAEDSGYITPDDGSGKHGATNYGKYTWTIPADAPEGNYLIQVFNFDKDGPGTGFIEPIANSEVIVVKNSAISKADAPIFSPNGGTITSDTSITLSSTTADADIKYIIDGIVKEYGGPFKLSSTSGVIAYTTAAGRSDSKTTSVTFTIDNDAVVLSEFKAIAEQLGMLEQWKTFKLDSELNLVDISPNFRTLGYSTLYDYELAAYKSARKGLESTRTQVNNELTKTYQTIESFLETKIKSACQSKQSDSSFKTFYVAFVRAQTIAQQKFQGKTSAAALESAETAINAVLKDNPSCQIPVFIFAGQSNMFGWSTDINALSADLKKEQTSVWFYGPYVSSNPKQWVALKPPTESCNVVGCFGPEISAAQKLAASFGGRQIAIIKLAVGGTSLYYDWWPYRGGSLYEKLMNDVNNGLTALKSEKNVNGYVAGFFWMQGEADSYDSNVANVYHDSLSTLISKLRSDLNMPQLPVYFGQIGEAGSYTWIVNAGMQTVANSIANTGYITTSDLERDWAHSNQIHFTTNGTVGLGTKFAQAYTGAKFTLTLNVTNNATGYIIGSKDMVANPVEFNCGKIQDLAANVYPASSCSQSYSLGTTVTLVASVPGRLSGGTTLTKGTLTGWGNNCSDRTTWTASDGTLFDACEIKIDRSKTINLTFMQ